MVIEDFFNTDDVAELSAAGRALSMEAPQESRKVFSTINDTESQNKENYFLDSADKISFFFEEHALGAKGELLVDATMALNKVGHALHTDHPTFKKHTFSDRIKEICWQLGYRKPAVPQSMYIYKNPGVGGEGNSPVAFNCIFTNLLFVTLAPTVKSHQDSSYIYTEPVSALGFWTPLDDATLENGCLKFIKGSHKSGVHRRF